VRQEILINRRAISPVIATVILMLMMVAAVGGAYHWMTTTQSSIQSGISASISAQTKRGKYTIKLVGLRCYDDRVIADIQNLGPDSISNSDVTISVYNYTSGALITSGITNISSLGVNDINSTQYIFYNPLKPDTRYSVKVSIGGVSEVSDSCYTIGRLVGLWHFDEGSGNTTQDYSNYGNNGTIRGSALKFDGVDDYVEVPDSASLDITDAITIEAWVKPNTATSTQGIYTRGYSEAYSKGVSFFLTSKGRIKFYLGNGTDKVVLLAKTPYTTSWTHLVATYDGLTLKVYINGIKDTNEATLSPPISYYETATYIGQMWMGGNVFNGTIDEVRIYNRALNVTEIEQLYHHEYTNTTGLVLHIPFKERSGSYANDTSGYGNNGTLYNFDSTSAGYGDTHDSGWTTYGRPLWTNQGKYGYGMRFNGWDDYVEVPTSSSLQNFTAMTLLMWVNTPSFTEATRAIIDMGYYTSPYGILCYTSTGVNRYNWALKNTAGTLSSTPVYFTPDTWEQIGFVWDGSTWWTVQNGVLSNSKGFSGTLACSPYDVFLGITNTLVYPFNGIIDEVRIYNQALTADEIRAEYEQFK